MGSEATVPGKVWKLWTAARLPEEGQTLEAAEVIATIEAARAGMKVLMSQSQYESITTAHVQ